MHKDSKGLQGCVCVYVCVNASYCSCAPALAAAESWLHRAGACISAGCAHHDCQSLRTKPARVTATTVLLSPLLAAHRPMSCSQSTSSISGNSSEVSREKKRERERERERAGQRGREAKRGVERRGAENGSEACAITKEARCTPALPIEIDGSAGNK